MKTLTKSMQQEISPSNAVELLRQGNKRFVDNLKLNRNLLQQVNETRDGQHPFAVIISCMDSRTSAELIFDQGLGDIFSIRVAGNIINEDILGSTEFGVKVIGAKVIVVLGHTGCGAIKGSIDKVDLGHLHFITSKIQRCIHPHENLRHKESPEDFQNLITKENVLQSLNDLRTRSAIINELEYQGEIKIIGGVYNIQTGIVEFYNEENKTN